MPKRSFETAFIDLSATIAVLTGIFPATKVNNHKIIWVYPASDEVYRAINAFNSNLPIPVFDYSQMIRRLRSEMMARKKSEREEQE